MALRERTLSEVGPYRLSIDTDTVDVHVIVERRNDFEVTLFSDDNGPEVAAAMDRCWIRPERTATRLHLEGPRISGGSFQTGGMSFDGVIQFGNGNRQINNFSGDYRVTSNVVTGGLLAEVRMPVGSDLVFDSKAGNLTCKDFISHVDAFVASGDVELYEVGELDMKSASGDVEVFSVLRNAKITTASGDVVIDQVQDGRISSSSGDLRIREIGTGALSSTSGDVTVSYARGTVTVDTVTGDIDAPDTVSARTVTGGIRGRGSRTRW